MSRTVLFIAFGSLLIVPSISEPPPKNESSAFVPTTISEEARQFLLKGTELAEKTPQTPEDWQKQREMMESLGKSLYEASSHKYAGVAEVLSFVGNDGHVVSVHRMTPENLSSENTDKAIMHIHGGGFCVMSPESTYCVCAPVANLTGLRVYCVDYRLAPEHPFPAALDDCVTAYKGIIKQVAPEHLGILGESAGASLGLTMAANRNDRRDLMGIRSLRRQPEFVVA